MLSWDLNINFKMKNIISLLLLIVVFSSYSQTRGGEAKYTVTLVEREKDEIYKSLTSMYQNAESSVEHLSFILNFDTSNSCFFIEDNEVPLDSDLGVASFLVGFSSQKIWNDSQFFYKLPKVGYRAKETYLMKNPAQFNWEISNETKKIDGFVCYKATGSIQSGNNTKPLIAWFCPDIPYSFGPLGIGGLPGLVLELNTQEATFGLKSLRLDENILVEPFPENSRILTDDEYGEIVKERMRNRG